MKAYFQTRLLRESIFKMMILRDTLAVDITVIQMDVVDTSKTIVVEAKWEREVEIVGMIHQLVAIVALAIVVATVGQVAVGEDEVEALDIITDRLTTCLTAVLLLISRATMVELHMMTSLSRHIHNIKPDLSNTSLRPSNISSNISTSNNIRSTNTNRHRRDSRMGMEAYHIIKV
jgi:hypothetical protein